jgi:hypothetical protein
MYWSTHSNRQFNLIEIGRLKMKQALLISNNPLVIEEFNSISALVNVQLVVAQMPTRQQMTNTQRIFVDHETDVAKLDLEILLDSNAGEIETSLVLAGSPTTKSWQVAADIGAKHIVLIPESRQWLVDYIKSVQKSLLNQRVPWAVELSAVAVSEMERLSVDNGN